MSLIGARGTLRYKYNSKFTDYKFYGKTGTLTGIRSLSGYFFTPQGTRIISIIHSTNEYNPNKFINLLSTFFLKFSCRYYLIKQVFSISIPNIWKYYCYMCFTFIKFNIYTCMWSYPN